MKTIKMLLKLAAMILLVQSCTQENRLSDPLTGMEIEEQNLDLEESQVDAIFHRKWGTLRPVIDPINGDNQVGLASLRRHRNGISVNLYTSNLIPGHTYTLWWVVYNQPEHCVNTPCGGADNSNQEVKRELLYATGKAIEAGTWSFFKAHLRKGDTSGSINAELGLPEYGGLLNPQEAEVHMVIRSHGPAIPGLVEEQIGSFNGGCTTSLPSFSEIPDEEGECANIQYAIFEGNK